MRKYGVSWFQIGIYGVIFSFVLFLVGLGASYDAFFLGTCVYFGWEVVCHGFQGRGFSEWYLFYMISLYELVVDACRSAIIGIGVCHNPPVESEGPCMVCYIAVLEA